MSVLRGARIIYSAWWIIIRKSHDLIRPSLFIILFLVFTKVCFGDDTSHADNFNNYVNSPGGSFDSLVNKDTNQINAINNKVEGKSDKTDSKPVLQKISAKWRICAIDNDCTSAAADCVSWESLNKKYLNKISKNLNSCSESIDPGFQPESICVDKVCKTTEKTTNVSWEEWLSEMSKDGRR
jgi:hypothetical protein